MAEINERNKRALLILAGAMVLMLLFHYAVGPWLDEWGKIRMRLAIAESELEAIEEVQNKGKILAAFEMPKEEDKQRPLFYRKMTEQLQKAGVGVNPMPQYVSSRGKTQTGLSVKLLRLRCQGKGKYDQILKLMAELDKNPYLVSVEEIKIACDPKKRQEMTLDLTVSTFVQ